MEGEIAIRCPKTDAEWQEYFHLRYEVLRKPLGQPEGSERNEGDTMGVHFALYQMDELSAIARLDEVDHFVAQARFVAVRADLQGKGLGKKIMLALEEHARKQGKAMMLLHARDYALDFYLNLGYRIVEPSYKLFGVLQHFRMEKTL
jgi:GNAT superfamily N-acetyltransferase